MKRLTSNKDVSDIEGMYELAHNSCYIDKDGNARYRDFETDIDARILTRLLLKKYAEGDDAFTCDDDFDEQMMNALQYGTDSIEGLIALFYRNLWAMAELRERLKKYEDAEENGLLLKLPCKVGDTVYEISRIEPYRNPAIREMGIVDILLRDNDMYFTLQDLYDEYYDNSILSTEFGKTVFLTKEEAEQALEKIKDGE